MSNRSCSIFRTRTEPLATRWVPTGTLDDSGETLELQRPDAPQLDPTTGLTFAPYITVDEVSYRSTSPWPTGAAGTGAALSWISPVRSGQVQVERITSGNASCFYRLAVLPPL